MLASGQGVYRFVMIGQISREQHQLVRPSLPHRRSSGGIRAIARPVTLGLCLCAKFLLRGVVFYNKTVTHCISIETPTAIYFEFMELFWGKSAIYYFEQLNFIL